MLLRRILSLVIVFTGLAACHESDDSAGATTPPRAASIAKDSETGTGNLYTVEVQMPELQPGWAPLKTALDDYVARQRRDFLEGLKDPAAQRQARELPWDLNLEIGVAAHTERFVNVQVDGSSFTGGAHPLPVIDSFTYDIQAQRLISLDDLFVDPKAAEAAFAVEARRQLLTELDAPDDPLASDPDLIRAGTEPGKRHYRVFGLIADGDSGKAQGLTFTFPPYQVAAYVAGAQTLDVQTHTFAALLKPEYKDAFQ
jgi:hypothetical protein